MSDAFADLCAILRDIGATMTLYGKPTTEAEVRAYAAERVIERLATTGPCSHCPRKALRNSSWCRKCWAAWAKGKFA